MTFSVIVPIYKVEAYLRQCVDSVLAQTYTDLDIVLADDGSPDNCPAICDAYARKDARVQEEHKPNGGLMSARQAGLSAYAGQAFCASSEDAEQCYEMGDGNTTLIHTAKGRTILLQYDVTTPRPYSRHQTVCGTKGFMQKYPVPCLMLDKYGKAPLSGEQFERMMEQYKHPFTAVIGEEARRKNMTNEMNYIMDYRLIHCLRNGLPLEQDVYDAAEWSCITELSERSVRQGSVPVEIPDFTRGNWKER